MEIKAKGRKLVTVRLSKKELNTLANACLTREEDLSRLACKLYESGFPSNEVHEEHALANRLRERLMRKCEEFGSPKKEKNA